MNNQEENKVLIVKYLTGEASRLEKIKLLQWLEEDANNEAVFNEIKASWALACMDESMKFDETKSWQNISREIETGRTENKNILSLKVFKYAALWILIFGMGCLFTMLITSKSDATYKNSITEIASPLGAKSIITLPDGTKVWLNAGSKLTYNSDFGRKDRKINLTGEAFFHVKTNPLNPFFVYTSDLTVRATGTKFNVKAYPDEKTITTTLEEGKVDIQMLHADENQQRMVLKPNENLVFIKGGTLKPQSEKVEKKTEPTESKAEIPEAKMEMHENIKTELYTSWKEKRWIIESEPLSSLVPKLERRYNMKIIFTNNDLKKYKFTGTIQNETVEQIMKAMCFTAPLSFNIVKDTITLSLDQQLKEKYMRIITHKN